MTNQNPFKAFLSEIDTIILEPERTQLYVHLMQSLEDIKNGDVCSMDEAIDEVLKELDAMSV